MQKYRQDEANFEFMSISSETNATSVTPVPAHARFRDVYFTPRYPVLGDDNSEEKLDNEKRPPK